LVDTFSKLIEDQGGKVTKKESWGLRNLAYRIKKGRKGHYVLLNIDAAPAAVQEMERQLRLNEDVVRFLTVRVEELQEGPSAVMQKSDRPGRGERGDRDRGDRGDRGDRPRGGFGRGRFDGDRDGPPRAAPGDDSSTGDEA
jgi:small subunit ribosomal protein S6